MKVRRAPLTASLSHLCFLIPPSFYLLTLLFLYFLLFLLLPSVAEAVQATEAGTGEGHGLSDALHPRKPAEVERDGREGGEEEVNTIHLAIYQDITLLMRSFLPISLLNTHRDLESKKKKGFSYFHAY